MGLMAVTIDVLPWVHHGGQSLYSVDVDQQGTRVITAGLDCSCRVWSLGPILSATAEKAEARNPKLLAKLAGHYSPVNTARFSSGGKHIATCSDDALILIYELVPGPGQAAFGETANLENWKHQHTLRAHSNNVVDVEWSPDGSLLASCSLDNLIVIWTASGKQMKILKGHASYVKGIAWDPVGTFLASQSDDKSIIIWRCSDWSPVQQIMEPFSEGMILETFSLRLNWSTDGSALMGVNSLHPPSHCACILNREQWDAPLKVVGHRGAVTVVRFNPILFQSEDPKDDDPTTCFALGSQDQRVTVWLGSGTRPVVILKSFFTQSVTDLAWTPDGHSLLACSSSGAVASFRFQKGTFGEPLSKAAREKYTQELYGNRRAGQSLLLESSILLDIPEQRTKPTPSSMSPPPNEPSASIQLPSAPSALQKGQAPRTARIQAEPNSLQPARLRDSMAPPPNKVRRVTPEMTNGLPDRYKQSPAPNLTTSSLTGTLSKGLVWPPPSPARLLLVNLGQRTGPAGPGGLLSLEIENLEGSASIVCTEGDKIVWRDHVKAPVLRAAGNIYFSAVALSDGSLIVYSAAGRRILPTMALGLPCYHLSSGKAWQLMAVELDGRLHLWDLQTTQCIVQIQIPAIPNADVASIKLTDKGKPRIVLADGSAYVLDLELKAWLCIVDPVFALTAFASLLPDTAGLSGELAQVEQEASAAGKAAAFSGSSRTFTARDSSRRHLESQLASALALESPKDYRRWLLTYVRHLAGELSEEALTEVLIFLLGPVRRTEESPWEETILGLQKHVLLKEVLRELSRHRTMQRLVTQYREMLDEAGKSPP